MTVGVEVAPENAGVAKSGWPATCVLMLTGTAPGEPGVGGVILADLVRYADEQRIECAWLAPQWASSPGSGEPCRVTRIPRRFEHAYRPIGGWPGDMVSAGALALLRPRSVRNSVRRVCRLIEKRPPAFVLAILESPAAIQVALGVHRTTGVKMRSIVWDDVELHIATAAFDRWTASRVRADFARVLQSSERVAVVSENMKREYDVRYGVAGTIVRHGLSTLLEPPMKEAVQGAAFRIGFAGSITAPDCFATLVQVLDQSNWTIGGRAVVLRLLGVRYLLDGRRPRHIEYFGWRSVMDTQKLLGECDLLYLPQTFETGRRYFTELSFPTKLSTYVASGRPILLHAPGYASVASYWADYQLGPHCPCLDRAQVRTALESACSVEGALLRTWANARKRVFRESLGLSAFRSGLRELLGPEATSVVTSPFKAIRAQ